MDLLGDLYSEEAHLNVWQMCVRTVVVFFLAIIFLRISGRRSFGLRMPLDVVVVIILGGVLSRAIVGKSPFMWSMAAALVLVVVHRLTGWLGVVSKGFEWFAKGDEKIVYEKGTFNRKNMLRCQISKRDILKGVRSSTNRETLDHIDRIYIERDGDMSIITKENKP